VSGRLPGLRVDGRPSPGISDSGGAWTLRIRPGRHLYRLARR
jgi:hypothetical protein